MGDGDVTGQIGRFVAEVGIPVRWDPIDGPTRLPGIRIDRGTLLVDRARLAHPGDLLHEAGHLAVIPAEERLRMAGDIRADGTLEMLAMAWSYAAVCHLGLDPGVVFHEGGYGGGSRTLLENFRSGRYLAVPMLQWLGMTADARHAEALGIEPYPTMIRWLL